MKRWLSVSLAAGLAEFGRFVLRAVVTAFCAVAAFQPIASDATLVIVASLAAIAVAVGQWLSTTKLKTWGLALGIVALTVASWSLGQSVMLSEASARALGPGTALAFGSVLRLGVVTFGVVVFARVLAARSPALTVVELAALGGALASMFAAHRFGIVARPLWVSDWAWRNGYEPERIFLAIGAIGAIALLSLLWLESRERLNAATVVAIPLFAGLLYGCFQITGLPEPQDEYDLGLLDTTDSELNWTDEGTPEEGDEGDEPDAGEGNPAEGENVEETGNLGLEPLDAGADEGEPLDPLDGGIGVEPRMVDGDAGGQPDAGGGSGNGDPPPMPNLENSNGQRDGPPPPLAVVILGDDYEPPLEAFYFRQEVWSEYRNNRLVPASPALRVDRDTSRHFPTSRTEVEAPPEFDGRRLIHSFVVLLEDHSAPMGLVDPVAFEAAPNPDRARFRRAYDVESMALDVTYDSFLGRGVGNPEWSDDELYYYLEIPHDPRYMEMAQDIISDMPEHLRYDPWAQAVTIKLHLDRTLIYSTQHRHANAPDPTADFLFGDQTGYCVHFAHATVFLFRSLGIPARIGTGYMLPAENRNGSTLVLRGSDAHAWPEIYVTGVGWVVLDINAQQVLDEPIPPMDQNLADMLGEIAREEPPDPLDLPVEAEERFEPSVWFRALLRALLLALGIALCALYGWKVARRVAPRFVGTHRLPLAGYRAAIDILADAGLVRSFGETRERFAERVAECAPTFAPLTRAHVRAFMRDPSVPDASVPRREEWLAWLSELRAALRDKVPVRRRIAGALNPLTMFHAR